ncbi:MAG: tryptophan-rich sensory protein [Clostridia bacterium]|nr:tryptophan-rich sensory protein [Clostridia bacterium]
MNTKQSKTLKIIITIISIIIVAVLGSVFVQLGSEWFNSLVKPSQWIPNFLIPIVWSIIYITFGIVLSIWISNSRIPIGTIILLIINGILNVLWCLTFFTLQLTFIGNIVIVFNLISSITLFIRIYKSNQFYAILTAIYPIWLCLATTLNLAIWILN